MNNTSIANQENIIQKDLIINKELIINVGNQEHKAFLQSGFYKGSYPELHLHKHKYTEVHILKGEKVVFRLKDQSYNLTGENLVVVPGGTFHTIERDPDSFHTAFQVDCPVNEMAFYPIKEDIVTDFSQIIKESSVTDEYKEVSAYITFFCNLFCQKESVTAGNIEDYAFLINEFFSNRYSEDIRLCDLAEVLKVSERQTERLVIECTGHTFREELTATRVSIAKLLMDVSDMSLGEISEYVGFHSYAGFWKAMKKVNEAD